MQIESSPARRNYDARVETRLRFSGDYCSTESERKREREKWKVRGKGKDVREKKLINSNHPGSDPAKDRSARLRALQLRLYGRHSLRPGKAKSPHRASRTCVRNGDREISPARRIFRGFPAGRIRLLLAQRLVLLAKRDHRRGDGAMKISPFGRERQKKQKPKKKKKEKKRDKEPYSGEGR